MSWKRDACWLISVSALTAAIILLLAGVGSGQCSGCQAYVVKDMQGPLTAQSLASGSASFVAVTLTVVSDGTCGPGPGTQCSVQTDGCHHSAHVVAFSDSSEFCAVQWTGGGSAVILPAGSYDGVFPLSQNCATYQTFDSYVFDASTLQQLDYDFVRRGCRKGCVAD